MHTFSPGNCLFNCRKDDVKEEAKRGLRATQVVDQTSSGDSTSKDVLPAFPDMVSFVAQKVPRFTSTFFSPISIKFKIALKVAVYIFNFEVWFLHVIWRCELNLSLLTIL